MSTQIIELAAIKLANGRTEAELLSASEVFQSRFLSAQDGFVRRDLVRKSDGTFVDIILWESRAQADAVFEKAQGSDVASQYFSLMEFDPDSMDAGVEHCPLLASFAST